MAKVQKSALFYLQSQEDKFRHRLGRVFGRKSMSGEETWLFWFELSEKEEIKKKKKWEKKKEVSDSGGQIPLIPRHCMLTQIWLLAIETAQVWP